ncbi:MAG: metallophosphoesterase [Oscillospiraceae bacterium]|nr:metallophosphoesterase [Oscillospiraceae bacterium]
MKILSFLTRPLLGAWSLVLSLVVCAFLGGAAPAGEPMVPVDKEAQRLEISVLADVHMEGNNPLRIQQLSRILAYISQSEGRRDGVVLLGDNTMNGQLVEYLNLYGILKAFPGAGSVFPVMGNHDLNQGTYCHKLQVVKQNVFKRLLDGRGGTKEYHSRELNGYRLIALGDEIGYEDTSAYLSQEQLEWFAGEMESAAAAGKPVFVFLHQPIDGIFSSYSYCEQSDAVKEIVNQYENVFVFNGHLHWDFEVKPVDGVTYINGQTIMSSTPQGRGIQVEVYDNRVELRPVNYLTGEWLAGSVAIPLD